MRMPDKSAKQYGLAILELRRGYSIEDKRRRRCKRKRKPRKNRSR